MMMPARKSTTSDRMACRYAGEAGDEAEQEWTDPPGAALGDLVHAEECRFVSGRDRLRNSDRESARDPPSTIVSTAPITHAWATV
jgi:hypothetical protein